MDNPILLAEIHVGSAITIPTTHSREAFLHDFFQFRHSPLNSNLLFLLVIIGEDRPEDDGAITSAWSGDEITGVIANALLLRALSPGSVNDRWGKMLKGRERIAQRG